MCTQSYICTKLHPGPEKQFSRQENQISFKNSNMKRNRRAKETKIFVIERETNNRETAETGTTEKVKKVQEKEGKVIKKHY
jgi:hypothetical protein